jgi:hypothetical protein
MEQTDYHAVRRTPLEEIKATLQQAKITALIADGVGCKAEDKMGGCRSTKYFWMQSAGGFFHLFGIV